MKIVKCPDGRPVNVPKSQKCAGKLYKNVAKEFSTSIKATVNVVDKVTVGLDSFGLGIKAVQLKEKLNNESIRMELLLKTSYFGLLIDPCEGSKAHQVLLKDVAERSYKLEELRAQLESIKSSKDVNVAINDFEKSYQYLRGHEDGKLMGMLIKAIEDFYIVNKRYPKNIVEIGSVSEIVDKIGNERLSYFSNVETEYQQFSLSFAGEDNKLFTNDDKRYKGKNGITEKN
jgi:hypothetical protein